MENQERIEAIEIHKRAILKIYPDTPIGSGIYILKRTTKEENCVYVGQSVHVLKRIAEHLIDYKSHIDTSLTSHGLKSITNPKGWNLKCIEYNKSELDFYETKFIADYQNAGYKLYNLTGGSQGKGKVKIAEYAPRKGYNEGKKVGYENAQKYIAKLFDKNLICVINGDTNKNKEKAFEKFEAFLGENNNGNK